MKARVGGVNWGSGSAGTEARNSRRVWGWFSSGEVPSLAGVGVYDFDFISHQCNRLMARNCDNVQLTAKALNNGHFEGLKPSHVCLTLIRLRPSLQEVLARVCQQQSGRMRRL